jgi:MoaA/NifB/PqqE/SkfB family radical SAM enzyme
MKVIAPHMQATGYLRPVIATDQVNSTEMITGPVSITGFKQRIVRCFIWVNILLVIIKKYGNPVLAFRKAKQLKQLRNNYRNNQDLKKYKKTGGRYYYNYNAPGWPSLAFNRYIDHMLNRMCASRDISLHTLVFAITKKCGFKCEHCCEWENLNKPERLTREDILEITQRFHALGISQLQISGGEPLNRLDDIIYLLDHISTGIDCWIYTTGYQLTREKALLLKQHGLTGITISLDDHDEAKHDRFRGKSGAFTRAMEACEHAVSAGLVVTFSICATREFISKESLLQYALLAKRKKVSFIQVLEPKAVGHYAGKDVTLKKEQLSILEQFVDSMNYSNACLDLPLIAYHGAYSRRIGCGGAGKDYLYVDTDGDVHNCPFCQHKLFPALEGGLAASIARMRKSSCGLYNGGNSSN